MRSIWLTLGIVFLIGSFALLIADFWRFIASGGETAYLRIATLLPATWLSQIETWAALEGSTWANINRVLIQPLVLRTPLWAPSLLLALIFRLMGRKSA